MFKQAVVRLTLWYLLVIMLLSIGFSMVLYKTSTSELTVLQHKQETFMRIHPAFFLSPNYSELNKQRNTQIEQSKRVITLNLIYFNSVILILGGAVSYVLAMRTLRPIEKALEAQKRFTADASHELRTPLTAMKTEIEVAMRDKELTFAQSKALHHSMLEEVQKLETLSNALLVLAKQTGNEPVQRQAVAFSSLIEEGIKVLASQAKLRKIRVITHLQEGRVQADPGALSQVVAILLDNAFKYSPPESTVQVDLAFFADRAELKVRDQGIGIDPADLPYIFNRFYRADRSRSKEKTEGYGLGLSIAQHIMQAHLGEIRVESEVGQGSTFTVLLPLRA